MYKTTLACLTKKSTVQNILMILFILLLRSTVLGNYTVPTGSMNPTILEGDKFFSNNTAYSLRVPFTKKHLLKWNSPERGEIIVFLYPGDNKTDYTKRVIGVAGDTIELDKQEIILNGVPLKKKFLHGNEEYSFYQETLGNKKYTIKLHNRLLQSGRVKKFIVPKDRLFVMGDNRDNSFDSRYWGFVDLEQVKGKLIFRWLSINPEDFHLRMERIGIVK